MVLFNDVMPTTFDEIVGQDKVINDLKMMLVRYKTSGEILPHLLLHGPAGSGKTSSARCVARELFGDDWHKYVFELNGSDDRGIGVVRDIIKPITKQRGFHLIIIDEADETTDDAQEALRAIMQPPHPITTSFILCCNKPYKIIEPIRSRCVEFGFKALTPDEQKRVLITVFQKTGIKLEAKTVEEQRQIKDGLDTLVKESRGDMRKALNIVERIISEKKTISVKEVIAHQKAEIVPQAVRAAASGDIDKARELMEDAFILGNFNVSQILDELNLAIKTVFVEPEIKAFLWTKLSECDDRCRRGNNPIIHLVAFMAYCFIAPQIDKKMLALAKT